jgi:hypothetical protein
MEFCFAARGEKEMRSERKMSAMPTTDEASDRDFNQVNQQDSQGLIDAAKSALSVLASRNGTRLIQESPGPRDSSGSNKEK